VATFTTTKQRTTGLLKKLALATALSACSFANAGVLNFEGAQDSPFILAGKTSIFGNFWVQSYGGPTTDSFVGAIIDGTTQDDICATLSCPRSATPSQYYAGLNDGFFLFGMNDGADFRVKGLQASFIGAGQASFMATAGVLIMQGFNSAEQAVGSAVQIDLPGPNAQGQFDFLNFDLGLFANTAVNYVRVVGYACTSTDCFRNTNMSNFAIDNIETIDAVAIPEPASLGLIGLGLLGLGAFSRKRKA
jgi:hypothetical protein